MAIFSKIRNIKLFYKDTDRETIIQAVVLAK